MATQPELPTSIRGLNWFRMNINLGGSGLQLQELHFAPDAGASQYQRRGGDLDGDGVRTTSTTPTTSSTTSLLSCRRLYSWLDIVVTPWVIRMGAIRKVFRGFPDAIVPSI